MIKIKKNYLYVAPAFILGIFAIASIFTLFFSVEPSITEIGQGAEIATNITAPPTVSSSCTYHYDFNEIIWGIAGIIIIIYFGRKIFKKDFWKKK